jgi:hypothetical protein
METRTVISDKHVESVVASLAPGETCLTHVKRINGDKFSFQIVELMEGSVNPLALLNASDERFQQNRVRPAWINGTAKDAIKQFGLKLTEAELLALPVATGTPDSALEDGKTKINIAVKNPKVAGIKLRVQIEEQTGEPQYEGQTAKRAGADGDFLTHNGELIYSTTRVVATEPQHVRIPHNGRIPAMNPAKFPSQSVNAARMAFIGDDEPEA